MPGRALIGGSECSGAGKGATGAQDLVGYDDQAEKTMGRERVTARGPGEPHSLGFWRGRSATVLAVTMWAVSQQEAPLSPFVCPGQRRRVLLTECWWARIGLLSMLCLRLLWSQRRAFWETEEVVNGAMGQHDRVANQQGAGFPARAAHALMDGLLVFLLCEPLDDPSPTHIRSLADQLERVAKAIQRVSWPQGGGPQREREEEGDTALTHRLKGISTHLEQRWQNLHALLPVEEEYETCMQEISAWLEERWAWLEGLHAQATLRGGREGKADVDTLLGETLGLSTELGRYRARLQECRTCLNDSTRMLEKLGASEWELEEPGNTEMVSHWTERLLHSNTTKFEKVRHSFLALEHLTSCFRTHLAGLKVKAIPSHPTPPPTPPPTSRKAPSGGPSLLSAAGSGKWNYRKWDKAQ